LSKIDTGLKTIVTSIQKFGKVVVESKPCELTFARKKEKQAQMMVVDLLPPMSIVCIVKLVFRCSYIKNSFHITVDDITYRFISEI
jgi:hypothetical protein